jgi:hypothetical protein
MKCSQLFNNIYYYRDKIPVIFRHEHKPHINYEK